MEILAPTALEYWAVRLTLACALPRALSHARISQAGMRLVHWHGACQGSTVVICGLAGALTSELSPGTVLVPERVGLTDGRVMPCDPMLVQMLSTAAMTLHFRPDSRPLVTAPTLLVGDERSYWSRRGFVAADMETGLLMGQRLRVATVRVVLDSPEHNISPEWLRPARALLQPSLWLELCWLGRKAPLYALRAAHVLSRGLGSGSGGLPVFK